MDTANDLFRLPDTGTIEVKYKGKWFALRFIEEENIRSDILHWYLDKIISQMKKVDNVNKRSSIRNINSGRMVKI